MADRTSQLSKTLAYALRHRPQKYDLVLDKDGWVTLDALVAAISRDPQWTGLTVADVFAMIEAAEKQRYEIRGQSIRAAYGHSLAATIKYAPAVPPDVLYHGTSPEALDQIRRSGLKPMRRQYVHLSGDIESAAVVAQRRTKTPAIITVQAKMAQNDGVCFHCGDERVWLAGMIAAKYLRFP